MTAISIVIPCYNDTESLPSVLRELKDYLNSYNAFRWEVIVVDDCSALPVAKHLEKEDDLKDIRILTHPINRGYGASLKTGIRASSSEYVMTMDSDGQHDPSGFAPLLNELESFDLVIGGRDSSGVPAVRRPGKWFLTKILEYVLGREIPDMNSGLRILKREKIMAYMHLCSDRFSFSMSSTMAFCAENDIVKFEPIVCRIRQEGSSMVRPRTALETLLKIVRLTIILKPLRVFLPISLLCFIIGFISVGIDVYRNNITDLSVTSVLSGVFIFCFGLISDQIAHLRREIKK